MILFQIRFISEKAIFIIMLMLLFPTVLLLILQSMFDRSTLFIEKAKVSCSYNKPIVAIVSYMMK